MDRAESDLRVLLLQIRDVARVRQEEHTTFATFSGLHLQQIEVLNVFDRPNFPPATVAGFDALFVGGASEASVLEPETYSFLQPAQELLRYCVEQDVPVFASCFGFQLAVKAFGGEIIRDSDNFEMGSVPISLTPAANDDPLFRDTPNPFMAISGHRERALQAPTNCMMLAYTQACCHAFRVIGKRFWAFQFHPEVDRKILDERLSLFREHYALNAEDLARILDTLAETPESNKLVRKFVERVLLRA